MRVDRYGEGNVSEEAAVMCYSYRDRRMEEEARREQREKEERRRLEQQEKERQAKKDHELVKA
jgi:hypothetical protein